MLTTDFRRQAQEDKEKYLNDERKEVKSHNIGGRPKDFFNKIKDITGLKSGLSKKLMGKILLKK